MNTFLFIGAASGLLAAGAMQSAAAQTAVDRDPISWHMDAGYGIVESDTADFLDDGWMLEGGLTWRPVEQAPFSLRADLRYLSFDVNESVRQLGGSPATPARIDDGDAQIIGLNLGAAYEVDFSPRMQGYLKAGLGPYRRDVELTQTALFRGIACDPFWGLCFNSLASGEVVVADDDTTRLGWSAGLGVQYQLERGALFLEASYLRVETSEPTEIIPIQIGFRF